MMEDNFEARCLAAHAGRGLGPERTVEQVPVEGRAHHKQAPPMAPGGAGEAGRGAGGGQAV